MQTFLPCASFNASATRLTLRMARLMKIKINSICPFLYLLTVLFVGLKLTNQIDWSWMWVLSPLWILPGLFLVAFSILVFLTLVI